MKRTKLEFYKLRDETHPVYKLMYDGIENFDGSVSERRCASIFCLILFISSFAIIFL